jgi:hypothetical protein
MSYNIDNIKVIAGGPLKIDKATLDTLLDEDVDRPEGNLLDEYADAEPDADGNVTLKDLWWYGEGSGSTYDTFTDEVLPATTGKANLVIIWEGGDSVTGLRVIDGTVTECDVGYVLLEKAS